MKASHRYLAFDLGASSGRALLGEFSRGKLSIHEIRRFPNGPVKLAGTLYWDFFSLWSNILASFEACCVEYGRPAGIGIDTWGVDFGLLGKDGWFVAFPVHYRDSRTEGIEETLAKLIDEETLYRTCGFGYGRVTSLAQLVAMKTGHSRRLLDAAEVFLMMPDIFRFLLCGNQACELTAAGSSQLVDVNAGCWSKKIFDIFGLPFHIMPDIVKPGTLAGRVSADVAPHHDGKNVPVFCVPGHDTASAVAAVPFVDEKTAFISCGTWSVAGITVQKPLVVPQALHAGFINEFGMEGIILAKNMMGLYLIENLYRLRAKTDKEVSYATLIKEASESPPFHIHLDVSSPLFFATGDPADAAREFLRRTGQASDVTEAQIVRAILEGLAFNHRKAIRMLEKLTNRGFSRLCVVGGGSRNRLLCKLTADAAGVDVLAGPAEATAAGNLCVQAMADGLLRDTHEIRSVIAESFEIVRYVPENTQIWDNAESVHDEISAFGNKA